MRNDTRNQEVFIWKQFDLVLDKKNDNNEFFVIHILHWVLVKKNSIKNNDDLEII